MNRKKIRLSVEDRVFNIISYTLLFLMALVVFYPLYFIVIASFSDPSAVNNGETLFFPVDVSFAGYREIIKDASIWKGYRNTILYTVFGTLLGIGITIPAAYALSRKEMRMRGFFNKAFLFTMYFSGGLIPTYILVGKLGLYNTPYIIILLGCFNVWNFIVARSFYLTSIPEELFEAAVIDGSGHWKYFISVVLPLSKSIIAVISLYIAVFHWNQFFNALIYLSNTEYLPLQVVLRNILLSNQFDASNMDMSDLESMLEREKLGEYIKYAVIVVSSAPVLIAYPFLQKYFIKGVMIGAVKG